MRKVVMVFLSLILVLGLCGVAGAQFFPENHYLVYQLAFPYDIAITVTLFDQFDEYIDPPIGFVTNNLSMDKFANPVMKNGEDYFNQDIHQTWWQIHDPQPVKKVDFYNQFGEQTWYVGDGRYLVLPAFKNQPGDDYPYWNHYKCYDATGPDVFYQVDLMDQWGGPHFSAAVFPVLFCNPCIKELADGIRYEIVDSFPHLAVYQLDPTIGFEQPNTADATDQFGTWDIVAPEAIWLAVPSDKLFVVGNETRTWGAVKSLYR